MKDAETGQRGYLLTDNEVYLGPYNAAVEQIGHRLDTLRRLTADNPTQQERLATVKQRTDAKLAELKQTIDLRQSQGKAAALAVVQTDRGKQDMDAIRDQVSAMERETTCQSARKSLTSPTVADFIALLATLSRLYALRVAPSAVDTSAHCDEERASALTSLDDGASTPPLGVRDPCSRCSCSNDAGSSNSDENSDACHSPFERRRLLTRVRKPRLDR